LVCRVVSQKSLWIFMMIVVWFIEELSVTVPRNVYLLWRGWKPEARSQVKSAALVIHSIMFTAACML